MTTQLRWHVGIGSAWLYAAARELALPAPPDDLSPDDPNSAFRREVAALAADVAGHGLDVALFVEQLAALAPLIDARRELAHTALTKLYGRARADALAPPGAGAGLSGLLGACERTYAVARPKMLEELRLRTGPLRELWEARGPGLLAGVGRRTDRTLIVESATVALVPPLSGSGGGEAYASTNVVRFEAMLANPIGRLPEMVRLAWLVSLLAVDQIEFLMPLKSGSAGDVAGAAMLPAVLEAATDLEIVTDDAALLEQAAEAWNIRPLAEPGRADTLRTWWRMVSAGGEYAAMPWNARLGALDLMLAGETQ